MKIVLVSKCSLDIEQYVEFKVSVLISPSKSLISLRWVTYDLLHAIYVYSPVYNAAKTIFYSMT